MHSLYVKPVGAQRHNRTIQMFVLYLLVVECCRTAATRTCFRCYRCTCSPGTRLLLFSECTPPTDARKGLENTKYGPGKNQSLRTQRQQTRCFERALLFWVYIYNTYKSQEDRINAVVQCLLATHRRQEAGLENTHGPGQNQSLRTQRQQ